MYQFKFIFLLIFILNYFNNIKCIDNSCVWDNNSDNVKYDLSGLMLKDDSYQFTDGDDTCTPETEPEYTYRFNFCSDVVAPDGYDTDTNDWICDDKITTSQNELDGTNGLVVAVQYLLNEDCYVIGEYDPDQDESIWSYYDEDDPSLGVTLDYLPSPVDELCSDGDVRKLTIDVLCSNKDTVDINWILESGTCDYHVELESYYGCPTTCLITTDGLCSSHGICAWDPKIGDNGEARCYCNEGYTGDDCSKKDNSGNSSTYGILVGLLITMLLLTIFLVGIMIYMIKKVYSFRKDYTSKYMSLNAEMVDFDDNF